MKNADADLSADALLAALTDPAQSTVVAYFTAPWCQPCAAFAPVIAQLAAVGGAALPVYKINIDKYPAVAAHFGVRSIPATILLKSGAAQERVVGARSWTDLRAWLAGQGVQVAAAVAVEAAPPAPLSPRHQAFYGNASLRDFLLARLGGHLDAGHVLPSFRSYWVDGAGTLSAALVESSDPEVFERVTGLPYGVSCVLDFLAIDNRADAERVFGAVGPATDLASVPLRFVQAWLDADEHRWPLVLTVPGLDDLRRDWLAASRCWLDGAPPAAEEWAALHARAEAAISPDTDPWRQLDDDVASMLSRLSPPPPPGDDHWWSIISARMSFSRARLLERSAGWTAREIALPLIAIRWMREHVATDSTGQLDQDSLQEAHRNNPYREEMEDPRRAQHFAQFTTFCRALNRPFLERLVAILAA